MSGRFRPSLIRSFPVFLFMISGVIPWFVDSAPLLVRGAGLILFVGGVLFLLVLLTTWFEFGEGYVRVAVLNRVRSFEQGNATLRFHPLAVGFFGETKAVELVAESDRRTVSLAVFSPKDQAIIDRELRKLFRGERLLDG